MTSPEAILEQAVERHGSKLVLLCSFQKTSSVLVDMLTRLTDTPRDQLGIPAATLMVNLTSLRSVHSPSAFGCVRFPDGMDTSTYGLLFQALERKVHDDPAVGPILRALPGEPPYPETMNGGAIDEIAALDPDAILVKGDLTNLGSADEYAAFLAAYGRLGPRMRHVRGNHDAMLDPTLGLEGAPYTVEVGGATLRDQAFSVFELSGFSAAEGVPVDGVLGYELFKRFVVRVDYPRRTLTLTLPAAFSYHGGGVIVPFKLNDYVPEVAGEIDGVAGAFDIDTGSRAGLGVLGPFVDRHGLRQRYAAHRRLARWTLPIWLYVSVTGVVIYWMLYRL